MTEERFAKMIEGASPPLTAGETDYLRAACGLEPKKPVEKLRPVMERRRAMVAWSKIKDLTPAS